jgi:SAM-dependent methyltransferase
MHAEITAMAPLQGLTLDLGSGREPRDPTYARVLPIGPGAQVVRVDLLPGRGVNVSADFGRPLPFRDESTDAVLFLNLLEHLYEPGLLLREIRRVLKPGGRAVGYVPFLALLHGSPSDFCRYTEHALERMLGEAGFASVLISPHGGMFQLVCTAWDELARAWLPFRLALSPTVWLSLALDDLLERPTKSRLRRRAVLGYWLEAVRPPASTVPEAARSAASGRPP